MKIIWILLGFISLILGTLGIVLPILPTVPFYMELYSVLRKVQISFTTGLRTQTFIKNT